MWSIVSNLKNAQALHTKVKCLVTNTRSPRLRILRGRLRRLVRSLGRTKLQSRRCAFRLYIRQNTWPAWVCHPVLSFCDRVSELRCTPTEVVHSTLFTTPKVHTLSFYCLVSRLIPKLMVLTRQRILGMMYDMIKTGTPSHILFPRFRPALTTSCPFRLPRCHLFLLINPLHLFGVIMDSTNSLWAMGRHPLKERKHFMG